MICSPSGFGPLDFTWPQRAKKLGTYDDKWFRERCPFFPEDMDWTCFNAAPEDQQQEAFFKGAESFSVTDMHPAKPIIQSRLPALRQRCFINQPANLKKRDSENIFPEVITHLDSAWLFPHAERGLPSIAARRRLPMTRPWTSGSFSWQRKDLMKSLKQSSIILRDSKNAWIGRCPQRWRPRWPRPKRN